MKSKIKVFIIENLLKYNFDIGTIQRMKIYVTN